MVNQPVITNIQKYSIHDGRGIRTTVFFKGCPLRCKWCHNPETQKFQLEIMTFQERCRGCGACEKICPSKAIRILNEKAVTEQSKCHICKNCMDECVYNARDLCGGKISVEELLHEIEKDMAFYETSQGGVTLSGGEVLAQNMDYIEALMKKLSGKGISVNIDTCGAVPWEHIERILPYTDVFLYDMKVMDEQAHVQYTGVSREKILKNLISLSAHKARIWIRIPVIGGVNDTDKNMEQTADFLLKEQISCKQIHLIPYHNTGSGKYERLCKQYEGTDFTTPEQQTLERLRQIFVEKGFSHVLIGG